MLPDADRVEKQLLLKQDDNKDTHSAHTHSQTTNINSKIKLPRQSPNDNHTLTNNVNSSDPSSHCHFLQYNESTKWRQCLWFGKCLPRRYCTAFMLFLGITMVYMMRVNLSVAIEPMACQYNWDNETQGIILSAFFLGYLASNIPGSYLAKRYGGKLVFTIGVLATAIFTLIVPFSISLNFETLFNSNSSNSSNSSTTTTHASCICSEESSGSDWCFVNGVYTNEENKCTTLTSVVSNVCNDDSSVGLIVLLRILMGLFEGVTFPAMYDILSHWTLSSERSTMIGVTFAGMYCGNFIGFPVSNMIINSTSWVYVFYIFGFIGIIWYIINFFVMYDNILVDKCLNEKEHNMLRDNLEIYEKMEANINSNDNNNNENGSDLNLIKFEKENTKIPWKNLLTNKYAVLMYTVHFTTSWGFNTLLIELPTFLYSELNYDLNSSNLVLCIPYVVQFFVSNLGAMLADYLIVEKYLTRSQTRKTFQALGTWAPGTLLVICGYLPSAHGSGSESDRHVDNVDGNVNSSDTLHAVIGLMIAAVSMMALSNAGIQSTFIDVSPSLSNVFYAISNTVAMSSGVISPLITGVIRQNFNRLTAWRIVFWISFVLFWLSGIMFAVFGKTERIDQLNLQIRDKCDLEMQQLQQDEDLNDEKIHLKVKRAQSDDPVNHDSIDG